MKHLERLDPEIAMLRAEMAGEVVAATRRDQIAAARQQRHHLHAAAAIADPAVERTEHVIPGDPPVRVRVHWPLSHEGPLPCIVSMHAGGYIVGSALDDAPRHDALCMDLGYVGVAVDYRLAPETTYPGPLEDCYRALRWVHRNADQIGVDEDRIGVSGSSAGGGLAASLALLARDRGEVPVAFQHLVAPMLDDRHATVTSRWDVGGWKPAAHELAWSCYLGSLAGSDEVPAYAAAARAVDLTGLPPAFLCVGALDPVCDETIEYAMRLNHAEVDVELHVYPGAPHGFELLCELADVSRRCHADQSAWLAARLRA